MRRTILIFLIALAPALVNAQVVEDCIGITNDSYRLACFDSLFRGTASSTIQQAIGSNNHSAGVWDVSIDVNPFDDKRRVVLINSSSEGQNSFGEPILLAIRCISGRTDVLIDWDEHLGFEIDTRSSVRYRIGKDEAISSMWNISSDDEATFYPGNSVRLIEQMIAVDRTSTDGTFVAQITPLGGSSITAIWNLYGLAEAVEPMREACGW